MKKKKLNGFTLAEVLIALTIIGVVAALTVPTLVQKTNKQEYVSALQKAYSTLSQATNMIIAENGNPKGSDGGWAASSQAVYEMYRKYLSNAKDCGTAGGCFAPGRAYRNLNNTPEQSFVWDRAGAKNTLVLADGASIMFDYGSFSNTCTANNDGGSDVCAFILVDVNGAQKPNIVGRDVFWFVLREKGLSPRYCGGSESTKNYEDYCGAGTSGYGCSCKVILEGRMDY